MGDCPPGKVHEWQIEAEHRHEHLLREAMAGFLDRPVIPQQKNLHQMSNQVQNDQKNSKATYEKKRPNNDFELPKSEATNIS